MDSTTVTFQEDVIQKLGPNMKAAFEILKTVMDPKHDLDVGPMADVLALANIHHALENPNRGVNVFAPFLSHPSVLTSIVRVWRKQCLGQVPGDLDILEKTAIIIYRPIPGKGMFNDGE